MDPVSLSEEEFREALRTHLTYREREILNLRYSFGDGQAYSLEEVGHIFKVTRERVRQIEARAIRKLIEKAPGAHKFLIDFVRKSQEKK